MKNFLKRKQQPADEPVQPEEQVVEQSVDEPAEDKVQTTENTPAEVGGSRPKPSSKVDWPAEYSAYVNGEKTMNDIADEHHVSVLVVRNKLEGLENGREDS